MPATRALRNRDKLRNRFRFRDEVAHGIRTLLRDSGHRPAWLARRLDVSPARISKILDGSNNFEIDTLADLSIAFGRGVHIVFGIDGDEIRLPVIEAQVETSKFQSDTNVPIGPFLIGNYRSPAATSAASTATRVVVAAPDGQIAGVA